MKKIVIIGANHAGTAAINTILDNYKDCEVTVFDGNSNISFLGCGMALWIGDQISGSDGLFYSSKEAMENKGAEVYMETPVGNIDFDKKLVSATTKEGTTVTKEYDRLILATGSLPIKPSIDGMDLDNVQFVKLFQNAQEVIDKLKVHEDIKHVTIVGAGYIGVELAEAFKRKGKEVRLIDVANTSLSGYYDPEFTDLMDENLRSHDIELRYGETVTKIEGNGKVERVVTDKGSYETEMVVMAIGFKPNNLLGKDHLKLFANGAYEVNKSQMTSDSDVYAIGDCATVYDNAIQDVNYIALATNAVRSGIVAAHNACGTPLESAGVQGSNGIRIWNMNMVSTGLSLTKALKHGFNAAATDFEDLQKPAFIEEDNEKVKIRIVYDLDTRRILGAQLASNYDISMGIHMFSLAIQEKLTIDKLKLLDIFFLPHFNQPYNYITMAALQAK
ncbi:H2O-forming NADH oxidase [Breznakia pachnodae]|uniref:NADH oxidase n=1 Tax=Breznakia pachnodae TaxID=265178 RepID=A0ABU0E7C4_9FIRM|nr:FAD-dependent oxidoreductase [Breznakia pachnodae]MDQ0362807.1 NADPH-dependent 2,4-dienoyl-CoA reductase/sulfur reductase-like enzyme [Breznakia pachnodae]